MTIMRGDALTVYILLTNDSITLTPQYVEDVEICIGTKSMRKTYRSGGINFDAQMNQWFFRLDQRDTFAMKNGSNQVVARIKFRNEPDFDVYGTQCGSIIVTPTMSEEVI